MTFGVGEIIALGTLVLMVTGMLVRHAVIIGKVLQRINSLEDCKAKVEKGDFMSHGEHDGLQARCQQQVYKDMLRLENRFEKLEDRMDAMDTKRDKQREKDDEWKLAVSREIGEIKTLLLNDGERRKN